MNLKLVPSAMPYDPTYVETPAPKSCETRVSSRRRSAGRKDASMSHTASEPSTSSPRQGFTFNDAEVHALSQLFNTLYRGGDVRVMIRSKTISKLASKFNERSARLKASAPAEAQG